MISGDGRLPVMLVEASRERGDPVHVVQLKGHGDPARFGPDVDVAEIRLGAARKILKQVEAHGSDRLVMAGHVRRPSLSEIRPDTLGLKLMGRIAGKALGDDGLLRIVETFIEEMGFKLIGPDEVLSSLLAPEGVITDQQPDEVAETDITRGIEVVTALGQVDVGQGAVIQQGIAIAVEAIEGTDAMLTRAATLQREGPGGVLVKLSKPGQTRRLDLPTIGPDTVKVAAKAGLRGIAVEAGNALIVDRAEMVRLADEKGVFIKGIVVDHGGAE
ncbi:MAG: UDP-2,3-diacylglucosamine diphosphatase LpxI [Alphaproteobacteria bacterium]